ncbi:type II secretory pathway component PulF [Longimicrobium terrae]|uniref:Type II secretory pathway component PulF n=2 Tax=Longimicrobium terrae TaxID=1639882 RepID=A0A841GP14_9BACT|nr:type II secretory pathway component PulF [Longimicrobium terrae]MBB6070397.1 type II secretory pathway component PulF [Longimicrobium terrae]
MTEVARAHAQGCPLWEEMRRVGLPPIATKMTRVGEEGPVSRMMQELT